MLINYDRYHGSLTGGRWGRPLLVWALLLSPAQIEVFEHQMNEEMRSIELNEHEELLSLENGTIRRAVLLVLC